MTLQVKATFKTPVVRVFDKDANINFYKEVLGFKLVSEENAIAIFSSYDNPERTFIIEESPTYRTRAVNGTRKHHKTIIKVANASDIVALLGQGRAVDQVFKGVNGYAFEATSPEGYTYLLHAEEDVTSLVLIDRPDVAVSEPLKGLSDFEVTQIILNVPDVEVAKAFYDELDLPLQIGFVKAEGEDLQVDPDTVWDLEYLEFSVEKDADLHALKAYFEGKGLSVYLDKKATVLVISDTSNIEIWFNKS